MNISELDHLRDDKRVRFSTEEVHGETVTIVSYMIADRDLWELPLAEECRGIVFNVAGECICRTFHKFFNVGENERTQLNVVKDMTFEILEKRDGSMLTPVLVGGKIAWKTKKSFFSDVAIQATKDVPDRVVDFAARIIAKGMTPIFEYTSKFNEIVIDYGDYPDFVLLAIRDNVTGKYMDHAHMAMLASMSGIERITKFECSIDDCLDQIGTATDFEGWCLRDPETGFYCKLKTEWYLRNHRAKTDLRERDVADMVVDETIDDIKSALALDNFDLSEIESIEKRVVRQLTSIRNAVDEEIAIYISDRDDFKSIALAYKDHKLFGLIMTAVRGKEPDYKKFWVNNYRESFSLKCVYNKNF